MFCPSEPILEDGSRITRHSDDARQIVTAAHGGIREHFITLRDIRQTEAKSASFPPEASILAQHIFGHDRSLQPVDETQWPVMRLPDNASAQIQLWGSQAWGISGVPVTNIELDGRIIGRTYETQDARWCHLAGVLPQQLGTTRTVQTRSCFEQMERALQQAGMGFTHVVRTWFHLHDILDWYSDFNTVRTAFFKDQGIFEHIVPASTGIGFNRNSRSAIHGGLLAIKPGHAGVVISEIESPLQSPALKYKSAFSRAVEIRTLDYASLYISGTASIGSDGSTLFQGNSRKQIEYTLDVVEAILKSRGMQWADAVQAVAYFKDPADAAQFAGSCHAIGLPQLPIILAEATICREDLLFEMELHALAAHT